jgi:long-chain acyl-CoA synthetase
MTSVETPPTTALPTPQTGLSLQRLSELAWERNGAENRLIFEGTTWTGLQLAERARRLSGGLRRAGLQPGQRVVVCMSNCPEVGIAYQAIWRAGAVATPVIFLLREDELAHVLVDSGATFVITTPEFLPKVAAASAGTTELRGIIVVGDSPAAAGAVPVLPYADLEDGEEGSLVEADSTEMAALMYTGGTTGRSKGVVLSHDALSASAWAATASAYDPELAVSLLPLPLSHVYGLMLNVTGLHAPRPGTQVLLRWFDVTSWLRLAAEHRVQTSAVVPSMIQLLLAQPLEDYDLSALRRVGSGGAPLLKEVADAFRARLPHVEVTEGYGCTETAAIIATTPLGRGRQGSVGKPAPSVRVRIELPDGSDAPQGADGEICVAGPTLMSGYWHAPEETAIAMRDGWLHTGDIGHFDADGYLYVVDRIKDLIIRGGFNVYPRDVEDVMLAHPDVVACAVVGRPDTTYGEEVVAFVQLRPGAAATVEELVAHAREHLSATKYPREVRILDAVPLTSVGKTDRKAVRRTLLDG